MHFFLLETVLMSQIALNVKYIIQPGGSISDESIISACNEYNIIMCTTGKRQFLH